MARVFLSYAREDGEAAERLCELIEDRGHEVFWDDRIAAGHRWDETLERELERSDRVVVLWSRSSARSEWVRLEAGEAGDRLLPARLDDVAPPLAFRLRQTVDLFDWEGEADHPRVLRLLAEITEPARISTWARAYQRLSPASRREQIATLTQVGALVAGPVLAQRLGMVPISDPSLRLLPAALAALLALVAFLLGLAIARSLSPRWRPWWWRGLAVAAAAAALFAIAHYAGEFIEGSEEVPVGEDLRLERRILGTELTDRGRRFVELFPELAENPKHLIRDGGGISGVWTASSIRARWRALTGLFALGGSAVLLALLSVLQALNRRSYGSR